MVSGNFEHYSRQAGIMYCGQYAGDENNLYIAFNMHWEPHELALPNISGRSWQAVLTTGTEELPDAHRLMKQERYRFLRERS